MKKEKGVIKLHIPAGQANPAPPVGPALGKYGINIMEFCKQFNERTKGMEEGMIIPAVITVYEDRTFSFITKMPPVSSLIKKYAKIAKGSKEPGRTFVAEIKKKDVIEIARMKMADLNTDSIEAATKIIEGSARSMGVKVVE